MVHIHLSRAFAAQAHNVPFSKKAAIFAPAKKLEQPIQQTRLGGLAFVLDGETISQNFTIHLHGASLPAAADEIAVYRMGMQGIQKILLRIEDGRAPRRLPEEAPVQGVHRPGAFGQRLFTVLRDPN